MASVPLPGSMASTAIAGPLARPRRLVLALAAWAGSIVLGTVWIARYESTVGASEVTPHEWPSASTLTPALDRDTLVMFVHPKCPCSRASLTELNQVMNTASERVLALVVFLEPEGVAADWLDTDTWNEAGRIPGATRVVDHAGREAELFGALTSGHVVLYDRAGRLAFSGGITESRGHAGDNTGRRSVLDVLTNGSTEHPTHDVFGCSLVEPCAHCVSKDRSP